jgi:Xaa-Pro aminopeptidase
MAQTFAAHGSTAEEFIVAPGAQGAVGHDMGSGPIHAGVPIVVDIWPRDNESFIFCDMTRTFVVGDVPDDVREWHRLCKEALDRAISEIRTAPTDAGSSTARARSSRRPASRRSARRSRASRSRTASSTGSATASGSRCTRSRAWASRRRTRSVAGDVVTVEPGCYRQGYGGVRLEDLVLVTASGAENLTQFPYDLEP